MKPLPASVLYAAVVTTVILAVAAGLFVLGSPEEQRARRFDDRRVTDLHGITAATDLYWTRHSRLPTSLDELASEPGVRISTGDPVRSEAYEYRALDDARYEVCASFAQESAETSEDSPGVPPIFQQSCQVCHGPGSVASNETDGPIAAHVRCRQLWAHESGRQCFTLRAEAISRSER